MKSIGSILIVFSLHLGLGISPVIALESQGVTPSQRPELLRLDAEAIRAEADRVYAAEERRCFSEILVNRCREGARKILVGEQQRARQLDIQARNLELAARRAQKQTRDAQAPQLASDKSKQAEAQRQETAVIRDQQTRHRLLTRQRKQHEAMEGADRQVQSEAAQGERERNRQKRQEEKAEKARQREEKAAKQAEEAKRKAAQSQKSSIFGLGL